MVSTIWLGVAIVAVAIALFWPDQSGGVVGFWGILIVVVVAIIISGFEHRSRE